MAETILDGSEWLLYLGKNNVGQISDATLTAPGSGYLTAPAVGFSGGGAGTGAAGTSALAATGGVKSVAIGAGGSGYTNGTYVVPITGTPGTGGTVSLVVTVGAIATVGAIVVGTGYNSASTLTTAAFNLTALGAGTGASLSYIVGYPVEAITITNPGSGYTSAPTIALTGGSGTGATATATRIAVETFDLVACLESNDINQSYNEINADTKCGRFSLPGTEDAGVEFSLLPLITPDAGKISLVGLQAVYKAKAERNFKITTSGQVTGDPIFSFAAKLFSLNITGPANDFVKASGSLKTNEDGFTLTEAA